jgi:hypothetical protein
LPGARPGCRDDTQAITVGNSQCRLKIETSPAVFPAAPTPTKYGIIMTVSAIDPAFFRTLALSTFAHAAIVGSLWYEGVPHRVITAVLPGDQWVGTTVDVAIEPARLPATRQTNTSESPGLSAATAHQRPLPPPRSGPHARSERGFTTISPAPVNRVGVDGPHTPMDLRQAMTAAANSDSDKVPVFGAVGVDPHERQLPRAFARALPVSIRAEPGWWRRIPGMLGAVRFEITLSDTGSIDQVHIENEQSQPLISGIIRRVARLLSVGTFSLPAGAAPGARFRLELRMELTQGVAQGNPGAEPGDLVEMGFEAPEQGRPGQAYVREAGGRLMRGVLRILPPLGMDDRADAAARAESAERRILP